MNKATKIQPADSKEGEIDDNEFDLSEQRRILAIPSDREVKSLHESFLKGKLNVQPDFQRQFVWDDEKSSQLIESALLKIPLPVVYFSEEPSGERSVIDGQQRLTAFFSFIEGKFPNKKEFKLSKLKIFTEFNKKKFSDLPEEYQDRILECPIRIITFDRDSDKDLKFEIFERLNSGSVKLNDQELRNCMYRGNYNDLLRKLSADQTYMKIMGYSGPRKRMQDVEYVLRFAAFFHQTYLNYDSPMKKFLNKEMEERRNISDADSEKLRKAFKNSVSILHSLLGEKSFRRFICGDEENSEGRWEKKFNASLFDILMWSFADKDKSLVMKNLDSIREEFIDLMVSNQDFIESVLLSTSSKKRVRMRFDIWRKLLDKILAEHKKQPRCFPLELKRKFYEENPTCEICNNHISNIDDAAMDHKKQYWMGGKTIPENARLVHRYCNNTRPRKENSN